METRANYLLVGGFVLAFTAGLLGFVLWLAKFEFDTEVARYDIFFEGTVTGLQVGSAVRFSGVRVGEVIDLRLDQIMLGQVKTTIEVQADTPVRKETATTEGTTASLEIQGLTGGLYVLLSGGSAEAPRLTAGDDQKYALIPSRRSSLEQVLAGAPDLLEGANLLLGRANRILNEENAVNLSKTLENVETFTGALAKQGDQIETLIADASETMENLREASAAAESFAVNLDANSAALFKEAEVTLAAVRDLAGTLDGSSVGIEKDIDVLVADFRVTAQEATAAAKEMKALLRENREPIKEFTASGLLELSSLIVEARELMLGLTRVVTEVERDPARFLFGNQQQGYETNQ